MAAKNETIASVGSISQSAHYSGPRPRFDMTKDFELWKCQLRQTLLRLGTLGLPASTSQPIELSLVARFSDNMRELYGESYFAEFITSQAWRQAGLDEQAEGELLALQRLLNVFDEPDSDVDFVVDLRWQAILKQVEKAVAVLQ